MWKSSTSSTLEFSHRRSPLADSASSGKPQGSRAAFLPLILILALALLHSVPSSAQEASDDLEGKVSVESIILDAAPADPNASQGQPTLDALARNVKDLLLKFKDYSKFDTRFYDLDNIETGQKYALDLKKKIKGMTVNVTPGKAQGEKCQFTLDWKQDNKDLLKQTNAQVEKGKWYVKAVLREDGNSYLLLIRVSDPMKDLKAERKKRGLPAEKKAEE